MARAARDDRARETERRGDDRRADREPGAGSSPARIAAPEAAKAGLRQIAELTAKEPEGVTAVQRAEEGWRVGVEVVVERRIPSSSDLLALYEVELDPDGTLMSYRRTRRYSRGRGGDDEGS